MARQKKYERKQLSFSTTMRSPERIADFVESLLDYEGQSLTDNLIHQIIINWIIKKLIYGKTALDAYNDLKEIYYNEDLTYTIDQAEFIYTYIEKNTKGHKEAGFTKGWPSRFDTYLRLPMEFGFIYYKMNQPLEISETGKLIVQANKAYDLRLDKTSSSTVKVSDIFLNALVKYQTNNPFRRNEIENAPFVLFLQTITKLKEGFEWKKSGIYRSEIPFIICWRNADAYALAEYINNFRLVYGLKPSDEIVYEHCLELLGSQNRKRFKMKQITKEGVDDFIRKLRSTGVISLRGYGRLIDINRFDIDRVNYIIKKYSNYPIIEDEKKYYQYMGKIDTKLVQTHTIVSSDRIADLKLTTLKTWAQNMNTEDIIKEFKSLTSSKGTQHPILKFINTPTRFEFLMSIALKKQFPKLDIQPNYPIDDEGMPTSTARGGVGDIEIYGMKIDVLVEVTMMRNKSQSVNEIPGIVRHLNEFKHDNKKTVYSLFVAPSIHEDTQFMIEFALSRYHADIYPYTIEQFIKVWKNSKEISDFTVQACNNSIS